MLCYLFILYTYAHMHDIWWMCVYLHKIYNNKLLIISRQTPSLGEPAMVSLYISLRYVR